MANKKENLKSLFTNTRTRVIIVFTAILLITMVIIGIYRLQSSTNRVPAEASVGTTPGIQSIPGALNPTAQYVKLQEQQNVSQAQAALKQGGSVIPTILRTQELGEGVQPVGVSTTGQGGVGFSTLSREEEEGGQRGAWIQSLKNNSCSKSSVNQVLTQGGTLAVLKAACTCVQLKDNGFPIDKLSEVCSCKELRAAGYNSRQLKDAGFSAGRLRLCGFDACELRNAGFTAQQMKDGGFSDGELKGAGFSEADIRKASGLPPGMTEATVRSADCQAEALKKLRAQGVTASAIRRINGCSATALKSAGFNAEELRNAGFTAAELKNAGFIPSQLKAAGYNARDLLNAGLSSADLTTAGFTPAELAAAEAELTPGITAADVKAADCDVGALIKERLAGVSAKLIKQYAGCTAKALTDAGFSEAELGRAGFNPQEILAARALTENELKAKEAVDKSIREAGCDPAKIAAFVKQGISPKRIRDLNNCSLNAFRQAGLDAKALSNACFSPQQLLAAGFTPELLLQAGVKTAPVIAAGRTADCSVDVLKAARAAGVSAETIKQTLGCNAAAMKAAGYSARELRDAGFSAAELKAAGFGAAELKNAGFSAKELKDAGYTAADLKAAGFSAAELKDAGATAAELRDAGFNAADLKAAGYSAAELKAAGFSAKDLKDVGFTAAELKAVGFNASELRAAGYSARALKNVGFSAKDLKDAGFSASALHQAGYTAKELADSGYTAGDLKTAGYSDAEINAATTVATLGLATIPGQGPSNLAAFPSFPGQPASAAAAAQAANATQLQTILNRQNQQLMDQRYQQEIQQRTSEMLGIANQALQRWQRVSNQAYVGGNEKAAVGLPAGATIETSKTTTVQQTTVSSSELAAPMVKTGDILFGVIDTSVNSDEPGPILATIVSGRLKGAKLIGSFSLPANASKMVISFNTMSVPGAAKTIPISAYAIDPDTGRTALTSRTDHHYLLRYGSLFASSFLEGFGNAVQSANTTVTIGGTGGGQNITIQNGIHRSALQNAVIGLATLGKQWGQVAQQQFNTPTTVEVYSGTGVGILFTQDVDVAPLT